MSAIFPLSSIKPHFLRFLPMSLYILDIVLSENYVVFSPHLAFLSLLASEVSCLGLCVGVRWEVRERWWERVWMWIFSSIFIIFYSLVCFFFIAIREIKHLLYFWIANSHCCILPLETVFTILQYCKIFNYIIISLFFFLSISMYSSGIYSCVNCEVKIWLFPPKF